MNKKGQGAMEYLMTYGWAILTVLIVGILIWQLGIFSGLGGGANKSVGFNVIAPIDRTIFFYTNDDNLTYSMENRAGNIILIENQPTPEGSCTGGFLIGDDTSWPGGGYTIKELQLVDVKMTDCTDLAEGDPFYISISISYSENVAGKTMTHTESGTFIGTAE